MPPILRQEAIMNTNMNQIGKFDCLRLVNEFDSALIELYGLNMLDAKITRFEALSMVAQTSCARKAAEIAGHHKGLTRLMPR